MFCSPAEQAELTKLALATQPIFAKQPGFVSSALHRSVDGTRLATYLQWRAESDHEACMRSPDWNNEAGVKLQSMIDSSRARLEVQIYEVMTTAGA